MYINKMFTKCRCEGRWSVLLYWSKALCTFPCSLPEPAQIQCVTLREAVSPLFLTDSMYPQNGLLLCPLLKSFVPL